MTKKSFKVEQDGKRVTIMTHPYYAKKVKTMKPYVKFNWSRKFWEILLDHLELVFNTLGDKAEYCGDLHNIYLHWKDSGEIMGVDYDKEPIEWIIDDTMFAPMDETPLTEKEKKKLDNLF